MKKQNLKYGIIIPLILFFIISTISIYSTKNILLSKQIMWFLIGFFIIFIIQKINFNKIINLSLILYVTDNILLFLLLIFGKEINGSKCWFVIPGIGSFQPSEFMKLIIILINATVFQKFNKKYPKRTFKDDVKIFLITIVLTLIPSLLTFLEPDTGVVIIYFLITFIMLFTFGIKKRLFVLIGSFALIILGVFFYLYFYNENQFISIFGTSFFYRIDRLLDWSNKNGMQITNALAAIKAAGFFGFGIGNTPIYIPEAHTDFIFSAYASNTGLIGTLLLLIAILIFDITLFIMVHKTNNKIHKFIIIGFTTMLLYQQFQNIGMNIGLLPITGITLPFISYGGSSLLSYMIGIGIILNNKITDEI